MKRVRLIGIGAAVAMAVSVLAAGPAGAERGPGALMMGARERAAELLTVTSSVVHGMDLVGSALRERVIASSGLAADAPPPVPSPSSDGDGSGSAGNRGGLTVDRALRVTPTATNAGDVAVVAALGDVPVSGSTTTAGRAVRFRFGLSAGQRVLCSCYSAIGFVACVECVQAERH